MAVTYLWSASAASAARTTLASSLARLPGFMLASRPVVSPSSTPSSRIHLLSRNQSPRRFWQTSSMTLTRADPLVPASGLDSGRNDREWVLDSNALDDGAIRQVFTQYPVTVGQSSRLRDE